MRAQVAAARGRRAARPAGHAEPVRRTRHVHRESPTCRSPSRRAILRNPSAAIGCSPKCAATRGSRVCRCDRDVRARRPARLRARPEHSVAARAQRAGVAPGRARRRPPARRRRPGAAVPAVPQLRRRQPRRRRARCWRTRTPCPGWATAAPTSARSATPASRPRCSTHWGRDRTRGRQFELPFLVQRQTPRHRRGRRPARPRRARAGLQGRRQRHRLRPPRARTARRSCTTCPPAASACMQRAERLPAHVRVAASRSLRRRRADRRAARPARPRPASRPPARRASVDDRQPRSSRPQCEWTAADVADEDAVDRALRRRRARRARRRAAPRARRSPTTCSTSTRTTSRCRRCSAGSRASSDELIDGRGFVRLRGIDRAALHAGRDGAALLGHRHAPRPPVAAEQARPRARRRDRPGQGASTTRPRAATSSAASALPFHCDGSDLVGLMCLQNGDQRRAVRGRQLGRASTTSSCASGPTSPPRCTSRCPYDFRGEQTPRAARPYYMVPVFTEWDDRLFVPLHPALHPARRSATPTRRG